MNNWKVTARKVIASMRSSELSERSFSHAGPYITKKGLEGC